MRILALKKGVFPPKRVSLSMLWYIRSGRHLSLPLDRDLVYYKACIFFNFASMHLAVLSFSKFNFW